MKRRRKPHTLGEFDVPLQLHCHHCDRKLPKKTPIEINGKFVIAQCPSCNCMTPFKREAA